MFFNRGKKNKKNHPRSETVSSSAYVSENIQIDGEVINASLSAAISAGTSANIEGHNLTSESKGTISGTNLDESSGMPVFEHTRTGSDLATLQNEENHARADFIEHKMIRCVKHPGHREFFPINDLSTQHLPHNYQRQEWVDFIKLKSEETVLIEVNFTSYDRPDEFGLANIRGKTIKRIGSGTAFIMNMDKTEDCYCLEIPAAHKVSGYFHVMTVAHVVFDDIEAQHTVIKFFHDDDKDKSAIVTARGVRVAYVDIQRNRSIIECRTHDLTLCQRLVNARKKREILIQESLSSLVNYEPIVLLISHPHGLSKRVSTGKLLNIQQEGKSRLLKMVLS